MGASTYPNGVVPCSTLSAMLGFRRPSSIVHRIWTRLPLSSGASSFSSSAPLVGTVGWLRSEGTAENTNTSAVGIVIYGLIVRPLICSSCYLGLSFVFFFFLSSVVCRIFWQTFGRRSESDGDRSSQLVGGQTDVYVGRHTIRRTAGEQPKTDRCLDV